MFKFNPLTGKFDQTLNLVELSSIFVPYTGAESDVDLGAKNFSTTGTVSTPAIRHAGDMKIQQDAAGDVILFSDVDVADIDNGKNFVLWRKAAEGDTSIRIRTKATSLQGEIFCDRELSLSGTGVLYLNGGSQGNVDCFGVTDVEEFANGKIFRVWRKGPEGDRSIDVYVDWEQNARIATTATTLKITAGTTVQVIAELDLLANNIKTTGSISSGTLTTGTLIATTKITTPAIKVTTGAGSGKHLVSDADGDGVWTTPESTVTAPIGSVTGWLKSFANTPALPTGWVEMNGQTLSDAASVYHNQVIPNTNGSGASTQRFLRGCTSSGGTGGCDTHCHGFSGLSTGSEASHTHPMSGNTMTGYAGLNAYTSCFCCGSCQGLYCVYAGGHTHGLSGNVGTGSSHNHSISAGNTNTACSYPAYYQVVWIMRVK